MKTLLLFAVLASFAFPGCKSATKPATRPTDAADRTTFTGTLRGGVMAIGGETTGWTLKREQGDLEVDVSRVFADARANDGKPVTIKGRIQQKQYVERGVVPVLVAESIRPARSPEK